MNVLFRPVTGTENFTLSETWRNRYWPKDRCGICGEYEGIHPRCWWIWLTSDRVWRGASDGEQQIEPDEPYPSRIVIAFRMVKTFFDPRWWKLCWDEKFWPWQMS